MFLSKIRTILFWKLMIVNISSMYNRRQSVYKHSYPIRKSRDTKLLLLELISASNLAQKKMTVIITKEQSTKTNNIIHLSPIINHIFYNNRRLSYACYISKEKTSQFKYIENMNKSDKIVISKLKKITVISAIFMIVQILGGYYAHSIAIFADAFHLLSDVLAYVISLTAVIMSYRPSPKGLTFGYEKLQPLGALINVSIIWFVTAELFIEATHRITHKDVVEEPTYMLATSIFGLLCNLYILNILHTDEDAGGHHNCSHSHHKQVHHAHEHHEGHQHGHHDHQAHRHEHGSSCNHNHREKEEEHHHDHGHQKCKGKHSHHHQEEHFHKQHEPCSIASEPSARDCCSNSTNLQFSSLSSIMKDEVGLPNIASDEQMQPRPQKFHNNINMEAAYIHILTDIILSIGVIISATIIYFFAPDGHIWSYWQLADPICTYLFSFLAIYSTMPIIKESLVLLLDGCSNPEIVEEIERVLIENPDVKKIESLRVWSTNRGKIYGALRATVGKGNKEKLMAIFSSRKIEGYVHLQESQELTATQE